MRIKQHGATLKLTAACGVFGSDICCAPMTAALSDQVPYDPQSTATPCLEVYYTTQPITSIDKDAGNLSVPLLVV